MINIYGLSTRVLLNIVAARVYDTLKSRISCILCSQFSIFILWLTGMQSRELPVLAVTYVLLLV